MSLWLQKISEINVNTFMNPPPRFSSFLKEKPWAGRGGPSCALPSWSSSLVPTSAAFSLCFPRVGYHFEDNMHLPKHVFLLLLSCTDCLCVLKIPSQGSSAGAGHCLSAARSSSSWGGAWGVLSGRAALGLGVDRTGPHCPVLPPSWARRPLREKCVRGGASLR